MSNSQKELPLTFHPDPLAPAPKNIGGGSSKNIESILQFLNSKIGNTVTTEAGQKGDTTFLVPPEKLLESIKLLRDDSNYTCTMLRIVSATDFPPQEASAAGIEPVIEARPVGYIKVSYVVFSFEHKHQIIVGTKLDRATPKVDSVAGLFRSANWYERECYDMLGVEFYGHPHHKRILLPADWVGHPLRRDYVFPEEYNGMKVPL